MSDVPESNNSTQAANVRTVPTFAVVLTGEPTFWLCVPRNKRHTTTFDWPSSLCSWMYPSEVLVQGGHPAVDEPVLWFTHARGETSLIHKFALLAVTNLYEHPDPRDPLGEKLLFALPTSEQSRIKKLYVDFLAKEAERVALGLSILEEEPKKASNVTAKPIVTTKPIVTAKPSIQLQVPKVHYSKTLGTWCLLKESPQQSGVAAQGSRVLRPLGKPSADGKELWLMLEGEETSLDVGVNPNLVDISRELEVRDKGDGAVVLPLIAVTVTDALPEGRLKEKKEVSRKGKSGRTEELDDEERPIAVRAMELVSRPSKKQKIESSGKEPAKVVAKSNKDPKQPKAKQNPNTSVEDDAMMELLQGIEHARQMESLVSEK